MMKKDRIGMNVIAVTVLSLLLAACSGSRNLVPSPNIYTATGNYPEENIPIRLRNAKSDLLFVTDRKAIQSPDGRVTYGSERSSSMALGEVTVSYGDDLSWQDLKTASAAAKRAEPIDMDITNISEIVRFPETPLPFGVRNGRIVDLPGPQSVYRAKTKKLQQTLASRLASANRKDVIIFVHGFNNDFNEAAFSLSEIWHFSGRIGVPVFYTWPAGNKGLTGYFKDREAGEFSIFHLKETILMIAKTPGLKRIHIVAHSRGTDVVTTALRELVIAERAAGRNPRASLKIENLILAAPDLDFGVVRQRLIAERFGPSVGQITVYMNQKDGALSIAQKLMAGKRFGRIKASDLSRDEREIFARVKNVHFIDVEDVGGLIGHAYFRENPAVLSDISLIVQASSVPGSKARPLKNITGNFWMLPKNYPYAQD